jgi:uncharacterized membrane-anchored protein YhcB (DUF1043 family)
MSRIVWLIVIALIVGIVGKAAYRLATQATQPQHLTYSEF